MDNGNLLGYYDNDTAATDELLVKYLSQNKDVILGDIISTIQKEQNEIIRQSPFQNVIVQGVAGSGKTTVAMHRISYILYNYEKRFRPDEFCIIGSNDMLLHYITSGLPELDVYHVGQKRMTEKAFHDEYGQLIIDEAQDFGPVVYYVLKQVLHGCYFTIMGDVSQNIHYETGMNDWQDLTGQIFEPERTEFHILAKSYRNTIEISEYAGKVLEKASFGRYKIQEKGYHTIAVICRTAKEAEQVEEALRAYPEIFPVGQNAATKTLSVTENFLSVEESEAAVENRNFSKGVMVLPIYLTKGLEFDSVILWNPDKEAYRNTEGDAKLLYVAITRALHELHIVYEHELTGLLE